MERLITLLPCLSFFCFAMLIAGCQKENQTAELLTPDETVEATERSCVTGCQQCLIQDFCCCKIDVRFPTAVPNIQIQFCGELPGCTNLDTCTVGPKGNCPEINGKIVENDLIPGTPFYYCQKKDEAIRIANLSSQNILSEFPVESQIRWVQHLPS